MRTVTIIYRIESRYPSWARWRTVQPVQHRERYGFDHEGLRFVSHGEDVLAMREMQRANAGDYRITEQFS